MKPILAVTMGDPAGIGPEIIVKALKQKEIRDICVPVVIGDHAALAEANSFSRTDLKLNEIRDVQEAEGKPGVLDFINMGYLKRGSWEYKKVSEICGKASFEYIRRGIALAMESKVHGLVTGPISKESINKAGFRYSGHTEILAELTNTKEYGMLLINGNLRAIHVTTHVSMRKACTLITGERVYRAIKLADEALKAFGIPHPRIAVAGLNPHSGEGGLFGDEEITEIIPAVEKALSEGINAEGPIPPDTVFVKTIAGLYDVVVAMYHDQGHIPIKLSGFKTDPVTNKIISVSGVNCTVGLPIIRSSVDHGTAFDVAGEGIANEESMKDAIKAGVMLAKVKFNLP